MTHDPEILTERLKTFVPSRFYLAAAVTGVVALAWVIQGTEELDRFLAICVMATLSGLLYRLLLHFRKVRLTAYLFAPLDFLLITGAVAVTGWSSGGVLIFHMWSIITAGMILGPEMAILFGLASIGVTFLGASQQVRVPAPHELQNFELFHSTGIAVVTLITFALVRQLDQTVQRQEMLREAMKKERDQLDLEVARRTEDLVQANRMLDARTTLLAFQRRQAEETNHVQNLFLASLSHEMRISLTSCIGFVDLLTQGVYGPLTPRQQDRLLGAIDRLRDLQSLSHEVIEMTRLEATRGELTLVELDPVAAIWALREELEKAVRSRLTGCTVYLELPGTGFSVTSDRELLQHITLNLLLGMLKGMEGSALALSVAKEGTREFVIRVEERGREAVAVDPKLSSEGLQSGAMQETIPRIELGGQQALIGDGHGLYIVRQLVGMLGGSVRVMSETRGARSYAVVLPLSPSRAWMSLDGRRLEGSGNELLLRPEALKRQLESLEHELESVIVALRGVFDGFPLPLFLYDKSGVLLVRNDACQTALESPSIQVLKHTFQEIFHPQEAALAARILKSVSEGQACRFEWHPPPTGGSSTVPWQGIHSPVLDAQRRVLYGVGMLLPLTSPMEKDFFQTLEPGLAALLGFLPWREGQGESVFASLTPPA